MSNRPQFDTVPEPTTKSIEGALTEASGEITRLETELVAAEQQAVAAVLNPDAGATEARVNATRAALAAARDRHARLTTAAEVAREKQLEVDVAAAREAAADAQAAWKARKASLTAELADEERRHTEAVRRLEQDRTDLLSARRSTEAHRDGLVQKRRRILEKRHAAQLAELRQRENVVLRILNPWGNGASTEADRQAKDESELREAQRQLAAFEKYRPDGYCGDAEYEAARRRLIDAVANEETLLMNQRAQRAAAEIELADVRKQIADLLGE